ncbi:hypothetical protein FCM35_KLT15784 [Carex littledalei]|uniref:Uncharacterized protein n=1 Tax=Carex littledalei TaxID=544730 RepID=A0A833RSB7_9POAL|nr:hypothetical protein FCM35_KLT15784 [Carex littledalei]
MADNAGKDAGSQSEGVGRRQPPRTEPKLPSLPEAPEIDATVAPYNPEPVEPPHPHPPSDAPPHTPNPTVPPPNPSPVAPPPLPSDASGSKPPPPNTSKVAATVPSPNPPPNPPPKKSVRGRAKRNSSSMVRPLRRSSRLNPLSTLLQDEPSDKDVSCVATAVVQSPEPSIANAESQPLEPSVATADVSQPLEHSVTAADVQFHGSEPFVEPREPEPELDAPLVHQEASEKGSSVGLKEVFDRMHLKDSDAGKVYVNEKAEAKMEGSSKGLDGEGANGGGEDPQN